MSALTWLDRGSAIKNRSGCQIDGCRSRSGVRHEPIIAGYPLEPAGLIHRHFVICSSCRKEWENTWKENS